ncbi:MAG: manganese efflux pump [Myxococcales bacterium]|nr:manganese efflux pump [Myxococcales bacterium]
MMDPSLWMLAVALAADAVLVAAVIGSQTRQLRHGMILAGATGLAQGLMPLLGAWLGGFATSLATWTNYLAAAVFLILAWRLARGDDGDDGDVVAGPAPTVAKYFIIAIATSIDALVAGATFPALGFDPLPAAALIGGVTFIGCAAAFFAGAALFARFGRAVRYVGAGLLVIIAVRGVI